VPPGAVMRERAAVRGTYWSINTDPRRYPAPKTLTFDDSRSRHLANLGTGLHFLGEGESKDLLNWGYHVCDVAVRSHYDSSLPVPIRFPIDAGDIKATRRAKISKWIMDHAFWWT
jgi:hypothetical protein